MSKVGPKTLRVDPKDPRPREIFPSNWTIGDNGEVDQHLHGEWTQEEEDFLEHLLETIYLGKPIVEQGKRVWTESQLRDLKPEDRETVRGRPAWRRVREGEGLTPRQLAEQLDISPATISRYESGARWPDNQDYINWLRAAADHQKDEDAEHVFWLMGKREGWHQAAPEGISFGEVWDLFNEHIVDPWLKTGELGHYAPEDHFQPA